MMIGLKWCLTFLLLIQTTIVVFLQSTLFTDGYAFPNDSDLRELCSEKFKAKIIGKARLCMILLRMKPTSDTRSNKKKANEVKSHVKVVKIDESPAAIKEHPTSTTSHPKLETINTTLSTSLSSKEPSFATGLKSSLSTTRRTSTTNVQTVRQFTTHTTTPETSTPSSDAQITTLNLEENDKKHKQPFTTQKTNTQTPLISSSNKFFQHTSKSATFSTSDRPTNYRTRKILSDTLSSAPADLKERKGDNQRIDRALPDLRTDESISTSSSASMTLSLPIIIIVLSSSLLTCC
uniref:Cnidarian restricted protein n=1 Tax=Clytia hemisphaerica TaxID=252671 RepID=A0A7M5UTK5_9CNID|eukprot:TCONS_00021587-protein